MANIEWGPSANCVYSDLSGSAKDAVDKSVSTLSVFPESGKVHSSGGRAINAGSRTIRYHVEGNTVVIDDILF